MTDRRIKVLVVDDSAVVREAVKRQLGGEPGWSVHVAADALLALEKLRKETPDVILLDLEMPRMNGLTFLRHVMATQPIPVVVCSGYADMGTERALAALKMGAVEIFPKPRIGVKEFLESASDSLEQTLRRAASAGVRRIQPVPRDRSVAMGGLPSHGGSEHHNRIGGGPASDSRSASRIPTEEGNVILLGASLGGPAALRTVLESFPPDAPGCVVVQHMLSEFTRAFVARLDAQLEMKVCLAEEGQRVESGCVLVAPGQTHLRLRRDGGGRRVVSLSHEPPVRGHRPSIDVLFESAAETTGGSAVAALLTGMGGDGACGLRALRSAGARTLVQDEATSTVFGMPSAALALDAAEEILPLERIGPRLLALAGAHAYGTAARTRLATRDRPR